VFHLPGATACASLELSPYGDLIELFERLRADPFPWLLDSALPSERLGRYSFAGSDPYLVLRARGPSVELDCRRAVRPGLEPGRAVFDADPLDVGSAASTTSSSRTSAFSSSIACCASIARKSA
jgi:anthranilate/para-aminobenzoate synthase component I